MENQNLYSYPANDRPYPIRLGLSTVYVSKERLSLASPIFRQKIYNTDTVKNGLKLVDEDVNQFVLVLKALEYEPNQLKVDVKNLPVLIRWGYKYKIKHIQYKCKIIMENTI